MNTYKRFPKFLKAGLNFLNESVDISKFGGKFSQQEYDDILAYFGPAEDLKDGGWILPNGEVLDFNRSDTNNRALRHNNIFYALDAYRQELLLNVMPEKDLVYNDDSIVSELCMALGLVRYNFSEHFGQATVYFSMETKPSEKQMRVIREIVKEVKDSPSENFYGAVDCCGNHEAYTDKNEFLRKFLNDLAFMAK